MDAFDHRPKSQPAIDLQPIDFVEQKAEESPSTPQSSSTPPPLSSSELQPLSSATPSLSLSSTAAETEVAFDNESRPRSTSPKQSESLEQQLLSQTPNLTQTENELLEHAELLQPVLQPSVFSITNNQEQSECCTSCTASPQTPTLLMSSTKHVLVQDEELKQEQSSSLESMITESCTKSLPLRSNSSSVHELICKPESDQPHSSQNLKTESLQLLEVDTLNVKSEQHLQLVPQTLSDQLMTETLHISTESQNSPQTIIFHHQLSNEQNQMPQLCQTQLSPEQPLHYTVPFDAYVPINEPYIYTMEACPPYQTSSYCGCEFTPYADSISFDTPHHQHVVSHQHSHSQQTHAPLPPMQQPPPPFQCVQIDGDTSDRSMIHNPQNPFAGDCVSLTVSHHQPAVHSTEVQNGMRWIPSMPTYSNGPSSNVSASGTYTFVTQPFPFCDSVNCAISCAHQALHTPPDESSSLHCDTNSPNEYTPAALPLQFTSLQSLTTLTPPPAIPMTGNKCSVPSPQNHSSHHLLQQPLSTSEISPNCQGLQHHQHHNQHLIQSQNESVSVQTSTSNNATSNNNNSTTTTTTTTTELQNLSNLSVENSSFLKFPQKLWNIVNNCRSEAIQWSESGDSIVIHYERFQVEYLSEKKNIFKTLNINSFIRQLNLYGFKKVVNLKSKRNHQQHEFRHMNFRRDRSDLLAFVNRNYHAGSSRSNSNGSTSSNGSNGTNGSNSTNNCRSYLVQSMERKPATTGESQCKLISIRELERNKLERMESRGSVGGGGVSVGRSRNATPGQSESNVAKKSQCNDHSPPIATTKIVYLSQLQSGKHRTVR